VLPAGEVFRTFDHSMPMLTIRAATIDDAGVIAAFNEAMAWETEQKRLDPPTVRAGVEALLADPRKGRYFVACVIDEAGAERVVGQLMHTWEWSDWRNGDLWWLQSVYVDPAHRRRGVFRALCRHILEEAAHTPGVAGVRLYVESHNRDAQATYERLGFADAGYIVMETMLPELPLARRPRE